MTQPKNPMDLLGSLFLAPQQLFTQFAPMAEVIPAADLAQWAEVSQKLQALWLEFQAEQASASMTKLPAMLSDPGGFAGIMQGWLAALPYNRFWSHKKAIGINRC